MARIRSIKPEFFRHHDLYLAESEYGLPLRVAFSGLWLCADKEGRFKWQPKQLKLDVLPYDELDFLNVLIALEETGFIQYYQHEGKEYGVIPTFKEHQRITGTEAQNESKLPCPPTTYEKGNIKETLRKHQGNTKEVQEREGKGKGIGREGKGIIGTEAENLPVKFSMQLIYDKSWDEYKATLNGQAKNISEIIFITWKEFVDFIWANNFQDVFSCKFVSPIDFGKLMTEKGFLQHKWKPVLEKICSSGVNPNQNLFFRIPQFMNYEEKSLPKRDLTTYEKEIQAKRDKAKLMKEA